MRACACVPQRAAACGSVRQHLWQRAASVRAASVRLACRVAEPSDVRVVHGLAHAKLHVMHVVIMWPAAVVSVKNLICVCSSQALIGPA